MSSEMLIRGLQIEKGDLEAVSFRRALGRLGRCLSLSGLLMAAMQAAYAETVVGSTPGELAVDETGAATFTIPIQVPPGSPSWAIVRGQRWIAESPPSDQPTPSRPLPALLL